MGPVLIDAARLPVEPACVTPIVDVARLGVVGDLTASVAAWHRRSGPATHTLADVASAAGYAWRSLADGTLWSGADTWDLQVLPAELVELLDVAPAMGRYELAGTAALDVLPGRTVALADLTGDAATADQALRVVEQALALAPGNAEALGGVMQSGANAYSNIQTYKRYSIPGDE